MITDAMTFFLSRSTQNGTLMEHLNGKSMKVQAISADLELNKMTIITDKKPYIARPTINHKLSVAPMLDWT
jgi:tRNA-dihydrouridine synthase A